MKTVVVGAGVYGSGIALALRDLGARVTVLESRAPAHAWAASGGRERVLRLEYGADVFYTRLAARAREAWRALETRLGVPLYRETGVLYLAPDDRGWEKASFDTARAGVRLADGRVVRGDAMSRSQADRASSSTCTSTCSCTCTCSSRPTDTAWSASLRYGPGAPFPASPPVRAPRLVRDRRR